MTSRMLEDGSRMPQDVLKDHPRRFVLAAARATSRMLEDGTRMLQDRLKDHHGNFWRM